MGICLNAFKSCFGGEQIIMNMKLRFKIIITILAIILLILAIIYFVYQKYYLSKSAEPALQSLIEKPAEISKTESEKPARDFKTRASIAMNGYRFYKNAEFGFEIQYPESWTVAEEINENVRGEMVKEFFFKKPNSDLRFAILPRDGLSYGLGAKGTSTPAYIGGFPGMQTQYVLKDGRRLWLLFPQTGLLNWLQDIGRIDAMTSIVDPIGDMQIFEKMLNSFKFAK